MITASAMFPVSWEWQLCPETAVQNCPLPGNVKLDAGENLKILKFWWAVSPVSMSVFQISSFPA
jgi:hypothetical protein